MHKQMIDLKTKIKVFSKPLCSANASVWVVEIEWIHNIIKYHPFDCFNENIVKPKKRKKECNQKLRWKAGHFGHASSRVPSRPVAYEDRAL